MSNSIIKTEFLEIKKSLCKIEPHPIGSRTKKMTFRVEYYVLKIPKNRPFPKLLPNPNELNYFLKTNNIAEIQQKVLLIIKVKSSRAFKTYWYAFTMQTYC